MTIGLLASYALLAMVAGVWLLLLVVSILSGAPDKGSKMRWRERLLVAVSVFLMIALALGGKL